MNGPVGRPRLARVERPLVLAGDDGVEERIEALDPGDRCLDQFDRRHLAPTDELGLPHRVKPGELVEPSPPTGFPS